MSIDPVALVFVLLVLGIVCLSLAWHFARSRALLQKWADDNGYQILRHEYRYLRRGPFFWTTSRHQTVYHVEVLDRYGQPRTGYVRCGGWWLGLFSGNVEVKWET